MADKLDNIESTNACEWDEETERGISDESIQKPTFEPKKQVIQRYYDTQQDTSRSARISKPLRAINIKGHSRTIGVAPHIMASGSGPGPGRDLRDDSTRVPAETWVKQGAVNSRRMQNKLDKEAKKSFKESEFLGATPHDNFPASGYYLWADISVTPSDLLGEDLQALDGVRVDNQVHIDFDESMGCIRLRSKHQSGIADGLDGVKAEIERAKANDTTLMPLYLVDPPSATAMRSEVSPELGAAQESNVRPTIKRVLLSGPPLMAEELSAWDTERQLILKNNGKLFLGHIKKGLAGFHVLRSGMRMRVHFGYIHLQLYRKDFRNGKYSFAKFSQMMSESRTKAEIEKVIGDENFTSNLLDQIRNDAQLFEPMDSLTTRLADVKPKHSLIVLAYGPSKQQVRVEADIDSTSCAHNEIKPPGKFAWQEGSISYYHDKTRKTRLSVGTLSLESKVDWCLEIVTDKAMSKPPRAFRNLVQGSLSSQTTQKVDKIGLEYPSVRLQIPSGVVVDKVWIRSVLQYKLKGSRFIVQVAIYREWKDGNTTKEPLTSCGVSLFHKDWDLFLSPGNGSMDEGEIHADALFPDDSSSMDGVSQFTAGVASVQDFLGQL